MRVRLGSCTSPCFTARVKTSRFNTSLSGSLWLQTKSLSCSRCSMHPFMFSLSANHWPVVQFTSLIDHLSGFLRYSCFLDLLDTAAICQSLLNDQRDVLRDHLLCSVFLWFIFFILVTTTTSVVVQFPIMFLRPTRRLT
jgi:hypothetical protein